MHQAISDNADAKGDSKAHKSFRSSHSELAFWQRDQSLKFSTGSSKLRMVEAT